MKIITRAANSFNEAVCWQLSSTRWHSRAEQSSTVQYEHSYQHRSVERAGAAAGRWMPAVGARQEGSTPTATPSSLVGCPTF